ncbi:FGGY-family carbohydrate kinase [Aeromicrobium sp. CF3.5]|uniref:FGGY-family carbohydrate kinase n=1 Tax=Aeromicrobium sp. CF3.5 TaxID=3373078 RepID=UPI003EE5C92C
MTHLLAIDGGSQSTKVSIIDAQGSVLAAARVPLRPYRLAPGGVAVHPGDDLWDTLVQAIREVMRKFDGSRTDIVGVGLCGIRFCRAMVGDDDRLIEPVLSWMDDRVSEPLADDSVSLVTSAGGYLTLRLTGQRRDSSASYAGRWPLDPQTMRWSTDPAVRAAAGMSVDMLPELVDPGDLLGAVLPEVAELTGLPVGCPVIATANDKAVEALGAGLLQPGPVLLSLGTYVAAMTVASDAPDDSRVWSNAACVPGKRLIESGGIRRGMSTVTWMRDLLDSSTPSTPSKQASHAALEALAVEVPAGSEGLFIVPDWLAPASHPDRRGSIIGLDARHGEGHLYRAVLEGLVLTMCAHVEAMEEALGGPPRELVVAGGGSTSDLMMQIVADVFGRPARRAGVADAAGLGAAICAAVGVGLHESFERAVAVMVTDGATWTPRPAVAAGYERIRPVFDAIRSATDPVYGALADLPDLTVG